MIAEWIADKVISCSWSEIIENYRLWASASRKAKFGRAKLDITQSPGRAGPTIRVLLQQDAGQWTERKSKLMWGMSRPMSEPFFACVARTKLRYKGWTSSPYEMFGFLRVGIGGAVFMTPSGDRTEIAAPPFNRPPPYMEQHLTPGHNGRFVLASRAHPDRPAWEEWEAEVNTLAETLRQRAETRGRVVDLDRIAGRVASACGSCGRHAGEDRGSNAVWRIARGRLYCASCSQRELL